MLGLDRDVALLEYHRPSSCDAYGTLGLFRLCWVCRVDEQRYICRHGYAAPKICQIYKRNSACVLDDILCGQDH